MEFAFNQEQEQLRSSVREVLADRSTSVTIRKAMSSRAGTDPKLWATIAELGWPGVAIDESDGGLGLGLIELMVIQEEIGRAAAPAPFFSTVCLAAQIVAQAPASPARAGFLRAIAEGARATLVLGQKDGSYAAAGANIKATRAPGGWTLRGTASLAPEAHLADHLVVLARTTVSRNKEEGLSLFVIPASALRSKPRAQASLDGTRRLADVRLSGVEVPASALLGEEGEALPIVARGLDRAAMLLAAEGLGVAQHVLDTTVAYAKDREQFGKPIGSFQAISHHLADMMLATEVARSHVYYAAWALEEGAPDAHIAAASAKAAAADATRIVTNGGIQIHGGIGFTWEHDMHLFYRRAKFCELYLGAADAWRERIAAALVAS